MATEPNLAPILKTALAEIRGKSRLAAGISAMATRPEAFTSQAQMQLAGAAAIPEARELIERHLDDLWARTVYPVTSTPLRLAVVGAGFAAAVFSAARVLSGKSKPLVFEASPVVGGTFAMTRNPSFYMNTLNRPGTGGLPGEGSLTYVPGALIQPSMLTGREYNDNADLGFAIRLMLANYATVVPSARVTSVRRLRGTPSDDLLVSLDRGAEVLVRQLIDARGPGRWAMPPGITAWDERVMSFPGLMARMDTPFPLAFDPRERWAIIGGGDSAKCAVEMLLGIGPQPAMSMAGFDYVNQIDWYAPNVDRTCQSWLRNQRRRYARIAAYLPRDGETGTIYLPRDGETGTISRPPFGGSRLFVYNRKAAVTRSMGMVIVDGRCYDRVVVCIGLQRHDPFLDRLTGMSNYGSPVPLARSSFGGRVLAVGAVANQPFSQRESELGVGRFDSNRLAMFRYGPRIAALGMQLT